MKKPRRKKAPKRRLALPDLELVRSAVLNSLTSASAKRTYDHAIAEFVRWYCSEPRLAFNRAVVQRFRIYLEKAGYAPATINLRLAAVRRIAYEAADVGLLSPELAASIRRVKGVRRLGVRSEELDHVVYAVVHGCHAARTVVHVTDVFQCGNRNPGADRASIQG